MRNTFKHQRLWLRVMGALPVGILAYLFQINIIHKLVLSDNIVILLDTILILLSLSTYYDLTKKHSWYICEGEYWIEENSIFLKINKKIIKIPFENLHEIFMCKKNLLGSNFVLLQIKYGNEKLKLYSSTISKKDELYETEFMDIYKTLKINATNLQIVKDVWGNEIDYWLKKPNPGVKSEV